MTQRDRIEAWQRQASHRGGWILPALGAVLLITVAIGLASEIVLQAARAGPGAFEAGYTSFRDTISLALVSLQVALPVIGAMVAAPLLLTYLVRDFHGTSSLDEAYDRVCELLLPSVKVKRRASVKEGKLASDGDQVIERVGGPAALTIHGDSVVITEQTGRLKRLLGAGTHTLDHYERIWETLDLRPQRCVREVFALTKEGIPISCDVDMSFKIDDELEREPRPRRTKHSDRDGTMLHNEEAVLRAAASRWICGRGENGQGLNWADRVAALVESVLRDILANYRLDWLIRAPQSKQQHPRDEIRQRLHVELEHQLNQIGAKLISIDLGQVRVRIQDTDEPKDQALSKTLSDIISGQWIDAWHANWKARSLASRAEGEAELLRMDTARIEAQAEMIIGLAEILQPTMARTPTSEPYVMALRLVEALRGMSYDPKTRDYMPPEAMRTLRRLHQLLDSDSVLSEGGVAGDVGGQGF